MKKGFTYPELIVVMGILATLFGFVFINLIGTQRSSAQESTLDKLVTDLKEQQTRAMTGDATYGVLEDYGVYFSESGYVLFHGESYDSSDTTNFVVELDPSLQLTSISFPGSSVVFAKGSGEVVDFSEGNSSVTLFDTTNGQTRVVQINRYGTVSVE